MEDKILTKMKLYYNDLKKALIWYQEPNMYFSIANRNASPKEMVEAGRGQEVLQWINLSIGF